MAKTTKRTKKRKRRSFWEPEQKAVVDWMNAQSDLGTSLQLIIVDAIRTYGSGDAVRAFLAHRDVNGTGIGPVGFAPRNAEPVTSVEQETVDTVEVEEATIVKATPRKTTLQNRQLPKPTVVELDVDDELELEDAPEVRPKRVAAKQPEPEDELIDAEMALHEEEDEEEYDPIAIMMNDIGSQINR